MTKHNLADHLKWLLKQPQVPFSATHLQTRPPPDSRPELARRETPRQTTPILANATSSTRPCSPSVINVESTPSPDGHNPRDGPTSGQDNMARLQFAPPSASKSKLFCLEPKKAPTAGSSFSSKRKPDFILEDPTSNKSRKTR